MKERFRLGGLFVISLTTALLIYPFLHEMGHALIAIIVGAEIEEIVLLPSPYVSCNVKKVSFMGQVLIGTGGIILPYTFAFWIKSQKFWVWYLLLWLKGISVYALIVSAVTAFFHFAGKDIANDDLVQILKLSPGKEVAYVIVFIIMLFYGIVVILREKPLARCLTYFNQEPKGAMCKNVEEISSK